jgi:thiamine kinase-like enzyme
MKFENLKIEQKINVGYTSSVLLISVNGEDYAVKIYHQRFNGRNTCLHERNNLVKARAVIPEFVPKVIFYSKFRENEFNRDLLVLEKIKGVLLTKEVFNETLFEKLTSVLMGLHNQINSNVFSVAMRDKIFNCRRILLNFLTENEVIDYNRAVNHFEALKNYYFRHEDLFNVQKSLIHGDLWWDNIFVNEGKVKIIDWLEASEQDYCWDLAQLKIGVLDVILDTKKSEEFFIKLIEIYSKEFFDEKLFERMKLYLALMYLEEAFYLPFTFFDWQIRYNHDQKNFENRFINFFKKSEKVITST